MKYIWLRTVAVVVTAAVVVAGGTSGSSTDLISPDIEQTVSDALGNAGFSIGDSSSFEEAADGQLVLTEGAAVIVGDTVEMSDTGMSVVLPEGAEPAVTSEGFAVGDSHDAHLHVAVVPAGEGGGVRFLTIAEEGYSDGSVHEYSYEIGLPEGVELRILSTGDLVLVDTDSEPVEPFDIEEFLKAHPDIDRGSYLRDLADAVPGRGPDTDSMLASTDTIVGMFERPWSVDAEGHSLPTTYEVDGRTLTQIVDTTGATFPVVSDPAPLIVILLLAAARAYVSTSMRAYSIAALRSTATGITKEIRTFGSFDAFRKWAGSAKAEHQWHHIVPQTQRFVSIPASSIHSTRNLIQIPTRIHQACVTATMNSTKIRSVAGWAFNGTARVHDQVTQWPWAKQYAFGIALLRYCGVDVV